MITLEKARALRKLIEQMAEKLTDTEALEGIELFPLWKTGKAYTTGGRVRYEDNLYKCLQSHTSQDTWTPKDAVSLWARVDDEEFPEWRQPTGSTDAYMKGDKVTYKEKHYISDIDNNVWAPDVYGWSEYEQ